jgi:hypothetical protein
VLSLPAQSAHKQYVQRGVVHVAFGRAEFCSRKNNKPGCSKSPKLVLNLKSIADAAPDNQACYCMGFTAALHTTTGNAGSAGLPQVPLQAHAQLTCCCWGDEKRNQVGSREAHMQQGHTGRTRFSNKSNKGYRNKSTVANSTQEHAGWCCRAPGTHETALQANCNY